MKHRKLEEKKEVSYEKEKSNNFQPRKGEKMNGGNLQSNLSVFLLGVALNLLAAIDYTSLLDYGLKAILGGIIWLGFKLLGEYFTKKMQTKTNSFQALRRKAGLRNFNKSKGGKK